MQHLIIILISLIFIVPSFCQDDGVLRKDFVILKNHSQIEGEIIEVSKRWVVVKVGRLPITFKKTAVASITYQGEVISFFSPSKEGTKKRARGMEDIPEYRLVPNKETEKRGFYNITYADIGVVDGGSVGVENISGYQWNQYSGVGLGLGLQKLEFNNDSRVIPVYTEYRGYFGKGKVCGYYNFAYGINIPLRDSQSNFSRARPGCYFQPAMGFKFGSDKTAFMLDLALRVTQVNLDYDSSLFRTRRNDIYRSIVLRIGIML